LKYNQRIDRLTCEGKIPITQRIGCCKPGAVAWLFIHNE